MEIAPGVPEGGWDVVVIGGGISGLTCAACCADAGLRPLVLEKHGKLGGFAQYFGKEFTFDAATWFFPGCAPGGPVDAVLGPLGLWEKVERLRLDPAFSFRFPDQELLIPPDAEGFLRALAVAFPEQGEALLRASEEFDAIGVAVEAGDTSAPILIRHARHTAHEVFVGCGVDARAEAVSGALWPFLGLPPGRVDALAFGFLWRQAFLSGGVHAIRGGARAFSAALAALVEERGGHVAARARVTRIRTAAGRAVGVTLENGQQIDARAVVCTTDPYQMHYELLEERGLDELTRERLAAWQPSLSAIVLHQGFAGPVVATAQVTLLHADYDSEAAGDDAFLAAPRFAAVAVGVPTLADPERGAGRGMVLAMALADYQRADGWHVPPALRRDKAYRVLEPYRRLREHLGECLAARVAEAIPVQRAPESIRKVATPLSLERYTFNCRGAAFGWANTPAQNLLLRPGPETALPGLYQCGQWTYPGGGIAAVVLSGRIAADTVRRER